MASGSRGQLLVAAVLFSTGGAAIKACGLNSWQVAGFRSAVAVAALLVLAPASRRRWDRRVWLVACAYATTLVLFVSATKLTTAANAIFLQSTAPLYILFTGPLLLGEPLRRKDVPFVAVMALGLSLFFAGIEPPTRTAPNPLWGNVAGAASGISWALTITGLRWLARTAETGDDAGLATVVAGNVIAFLACLPLAVPVESSSAADWMIVAYLGLFQIALAYVFVTRGMRGVTALEGMLLLLLEPVLNPTWTWLVHAERPGPWSLAGGAIILSMTVARSWPDLAGRVAPKV